MKAHSVLKLPREHGAWAMLYVPLFAGVVAAGRISFSVFLLALATTSFFISREPLMAWIKARRCQKDPGRSRILMLVYIGSGLLFAAPLIVVSRLFWLLPLGLLVLVLLWVNSALAARGREEYAARGWRAASEISGIAGLALGAPAAYYTASGGLGGTAAWLWLLSTLYFISSVFYVQMRVLSCNRRRPEAYRKAQSYCAAYHLLLLIGLVLLARLGSFNFLVLIAFAPALVRALFHLVRPRGRLSLGRIGALEIVYSAVFLVFIALAFRPIA
jgi:hypothetical protein